MASSSLKYLGTQQNRISNSVRGLNTSLFVGKLMDWIVRERTVVSWMLDLSSHRYFHWLRQMMLFVCRRGKEFLSSLWLTNDQNLCQLFDEQVKRTPDALAIADIRTWWNRWKRHGMNNINKGWRKLFNQTKKRPIGGIHSAVVCTLCARTSLPVLLIEMSIRQSNSEVQRSRVQIQWLTWTFLMSLGQNWISLKRSITSSDGCEEKSREYVCSRVVFVAVLDEFLLLGWNQT